MPLRNLSLIRQIPISHSNLALGLNFELSNSASEPMRIFRNGRSWLCEMKCYTVSPNGVQVWMHVSVIWAHEVRNIISVFPTRKYHKIPKQKNQTEARRKRHFGSWDHDYRNTIKIQTLRIYFLNFINESIQIPN